MSNKLNRRKFMVSTLAVSGTALSSGTALGSGCALGMAGGQPSEHAVTAILKQRLPKLTLDEVSLKSYVEDVMHRLRACRNRDGAAFAGIFKNTPDSRQLEHFFVQDFLVRSNAFSVAHQGEPVAFQVG